MLWHENTAETGLAGECPRAAEELVQNTYSIRVFDVFGMWRVLQIFVIANLAQTLKTLRRNL